MFPKFIWQILLNIFNHLLKLVFGQQVWGITHFMHKLGIRHFGWNHEKTFFWSSLCIFLFWVSEGSFIYTAVRSCEEGFSLDFYKPHSYNIGDISIFFIFSAHVRTLGVSGRVPIHQPQAHFVLKETQGDRCMSQIVITWMIRTDYRSENFWRGIKLRPQWLGPSFWRREVSRASFFQHWSMFAFILCSWKYLLLNYSELSLSEHSVTNTEWLIRLIFHSKSPALFSQGSISMGFTIIIQVNQLVYANDNKENLSQRNCQINYFMDTKKPLCFSPTVYASKN